MTALGRTKRRFAHELYPHPAEGEVRPLTVEVPYLYARAVGMQTWGTGWADDDSAEGRTRHVERIVLMIAAQQEAFLADALLQGLTGDDAWRWAVERNQAEIGGEFVYERGVHYGVEPEAIKPYPCGPEPRTHSHYGPRDPTGWRNVITIRMPESECDECCEVDTSVPISPDQQTLPLPT